MLNLHSKKSYRLQFVFLCLGFSTIYIATFLNFRVPGIDIPITGQSLAVLTVSYLWPYKLGLYAVVSYVCIGILGFPVFTNGAYGFETIMGNSGGYIYGFVFASWFVLKHKTNYNNNRISRIFYIMLIGTVIILAVGYLHLSFIIGTKAAFIYGVKPFLLGGLIKILVGTIIVWFAKWLFKQPHIIS